MQFMYLTAYCKTQIFRVMKLLSVLLLAGTLHCAAGAYAQINISVKNAPLEQVFKIVERQADYVFFFPYSALRQARPVTLRVQQATLQQVLDACFKEQPFGYIIKNKTIGYAPAPQVHTDTAVIPQQLPPAPPLIDVKGRVVDEEGKPVAGASVQVKGAAGKGVSTNTEGYFELKGLDENVVLLVSGVNIESREVKVSGKTILGDVVVKVKVAEGEEVLLEVNTGYFSVPKERATGSFTHVDQKLLSRSVGSNIIDRLKDVVPGLTFNQSTMGTTTLYNQPSISIRGRSTIRASAEPLIILDNFPYEGDLNDINPEDIASVTVLQDAAAASIWGARAGNGVIVLTSKKGGFDRPLRVTVRSDFSISEKPDLYYNPTMSMDDFIEVERFLFNKGAWNSIINQGYSYLTPAVELLKRNRDGTLSDTELEAGLNQLKSQDVRRDLNKYYYQSTSLRKMAVNFEGGGRYNTYYFSLGWDENLGGERGNMADRFSINARNSYQLWKDKIKFDMGVQFSKRSNTSPRLSASTYNVLYDRLADEQGNPLSIGASNSFRQSYIDTAGGGLLKDWNFRPLAEIGMNTVKNSELSYQLSTGLQVNPVKGITGSFQYRYNSGIRDLHNEMDAESFYIRNLYNQFAQLNRSEGIVSSAVPQGGSLTTVSNTYQQHSGRGQVAVNKEWSRHELAVVAGGELNSLTTLYKTEAIRLGYQPSTETYTHFDLNATYPRYHLPSASQILVSPIQPIRETTTNRNVLLFGNLSYTFNKRYTFSFSARKDAANIFGVETNKRGRPFWSTGVAWKVHEEDFFKIDWLEKLSFRGTIGTMGNVSTTSAYLTASVAANTHYNTGRVYQSIITPPNPLLTWEQVKMMNAGIDFSALNGRLSGSIEHYRRNSTNLLSYNQMAPTSGVSLFYGNWSSMKSWGWDLVLNSQNLEGDLSWTTNFIFSKVNDKVTEYYQKPSSDRLYLTSALGLYPIEGKPLHGIYSFAYAGLDENGNPLGYVDGELSTNYSAIYNNTPLSEYIYHGRATPAIFGSIRNNFGYKDVELSFNITYQLGYYFRNRSFSSQALYSVTGYWSTPYQSDYANRWQKPGDELITRIPAALYPVNGNRESYYTMVEDHVHRGDHIRFRDIRLGYSFPKLKNSFVKGLQVYGYVDNIGLIWAANKIGLDPQFLPGPGTSFPTPRNYAIGATIQF